MAKVPELDAPQVAPQELPDVQQRAPMRLMQFADIGPGEQIRAGQAMQTAGSDLAQIAIAQQIQTNETAVKNAEAATTQSDTALLWDGPNSLMNLKGQAAVDAAPQVIKSMQEQRAKIAESLGNDNQKQMYGQASMATFAAAQRQSLAHVGQQRTVADLDASALRAQTASDAAIKSYNPLPGADNSPFVQYIANQQAELEHQAAAKGIPADQVGQFVKDGMVNTYSGLITHLLAQPGMGKQAQDALAQVRDQLPAAVADKLTDMTQQGASADKVLAYTDNLTDSVKGVDAQLKQIRADFDSGNLTGDERKQAEQRVEQLERRREQQDNKYEASIVGQAQDFLLKNPGAGVTDLPRPLYIALQNRGHLAALDAFANRENNKSDPVVWHNVLTHMGDGSAQDPVAMTDAQWLLLHNNGMSDQDWKRADKERDDIKNGIVPKKDDPGNVTSGAFNAALNPRLAPLGIDTKDKAQLGALQQFVHQWILDDQAAAGHRFNNDELGKSMDKLFATNVNFRNTFLGISTGTTSQRLLAMKASDIPSDEVEAIKTRLASEGNNNPSDQDVMMRYWSKKGAALHVR